MYRFVKRFLDIFLALMATIILLPLFLTVSLILAFTGEKEILYFQKRVGFRNKPFYIWKFATMVKDSPNIGTGEITLRNDPRVTPFGKFLRKTKINELPQVFNVLKGDMSIVGPRPLMQVSFDLFDEETKRNIYKVRPGITGIASLVFRDEEKIVSLADDPRLMYKSIYPYKASLETWYNKNISFSTDALIIMMTAWSIFFPSSAEKIDSVFKNLPLRTKFIGDLQAVNNKLHHT